MSVTAVSLIKRLTAASLSGTVATSRSINTTAPLAGGGNLTADRTLSIAITPVNDGGAVALQASSPGTAQTGNLNLSNKVKALLLEGTLTGNVVGNVTGDLTGNVTGNVTGYARQLKSASGIVDVSAAAAPITGQVLCATSATTATWQSVAGTGTVSSIATTLPITGGPITASGTIGIAVTPTNNGGAVALQATSPGTQQSGSLNVVVARAETLQATSAPTDPAIAAADIHGSVIITDANASATPNAQIRSLFSRGAIGAPTVVQNGDALGIYAGYGYNNNTTTYQRAAAIQLMNDSVVGASTALDGKISFRTSKADGTFNEIAYINNLGAVFQYNGIQTTGFALNVATITLANGLNSNVNIAQGVTVARIAGPTGVFSLGGVANGVNGRILLGYNTTAFQLTIVNLDASSTATNQIVTPTGADVNCKNFLMVWNTISSQWILLLYV